MVDRIKLILEKQDLTPAGFADTIGIQRSGMSHILNGRNKPSLDFIVKTLQHFPSINPDWLLTGDGEMYRNERGFKSRPMPAEPTIFDVLSAQNDVVENDDVDFQEVHLNVHPTDQVSAQSSQTDSSVDRSLLRDEEPAVYQTERGHKSELMVDQVVIFYSDLTCRVYKPNEEGK